MQIEVIEVKPVPPPKEYILRLNQNELDLIAMLVGRTGGFDGEGGWKCVLDRIWKEIFPHSTYKSSDGILDNIGHIKSKPKVKPV